MDNRERGFYARDVFPMHTGYPEHGNSMDETKGRSRHKNHNNRVVWNMEKKNWVRRGKVPNKTYVISAKDLTIELLEGRESPYHK